jgi:hypothetical protein
VAAYEKLGTGMQDHETVYRVVVRRALAAGDPSNLAVHFAVGVLDRYRGDAAFSIIRPDTVGRLRRQGGWTLDFGIAPDESLVHACVGDLLRLPEPEREHWAAFATLAPASKMFLQMRLAPGSCFDDGEVRPWD